jgi:hypothetical protein
MKKNIIIGVAVVALIGAGCFYGGLTYGKGGKPGVNNFGKGDFANLTESERAERFAQMGNGVNPIGQRTNRIGGADMIGGEIISIDDVSITVKLPDNGSKIIYISASTKVSKMIEGNLEDLASGTSIMINGTTDSDGNITAETIQIR